MSTFRERIEGHLVIFFLGTLLTGFLAGIATHQAILKMADLRVVSSAEIQKREDAITEATNHRDALLREKRFLELFLRYALSNLEPFKHQEEYQNPDAFREELDNYIAEFVEEADKSDSIVAVGKGSGRQTTITFRDGSRWTVPPAFRSAVAN